MRLILIRHAETEGNRNRYVGREDVPLNAAGLAQASALARALRSEPIAALFSSPLSRAVATADAIAAGRGVEVRVRPGLVEVDYGELGGVVKGARPFNLRKEHLHDPMPGGESLADVWNRLGPVVDELRSMGEATVAVVGHYWSNRVLLGQMSGVDLRATLQAGHYKPGNASAYVVDLRCGQAAVKPRAGVWLHGGAHGPAPMGR